jgi:hypothetical protein
MNTLDVYTIGVAPWARAGACRLPLDATADGRRKKRDDAAGVTRAPWKNLSEKSAASTQRESPAWLAPNRASRLLIFRSAHI